MVKKKQENNVTITKIPAFGGVWFYSGHDNTQWYNKEKVDRKNGLAMSMEKEKEKM